MNGSDSGCVYKPRLQHRAKIILSTKSGTKAKTYRRGVASAPAISQSFFLSITPFDCIWANAQIFNRRGGAILHGCVCVIVMHRSHGRGHTNNDSDRLWVGCRWAKYLLNLENDSRHYLQRSSINTNNKYIFVLPHVQRLTHTLQNHTVKLLGLKRPSPW